MGELPLPIPHSPATLAGVVAAHLVGALALIHLMERAPMIEPAPIAVTLVNAPVPLRQGDEPPPRSEAPPLPVPAPVAVRTPVAQLPPPPEHKLAEPIEPPPPVTPPEEPPPQPAAEPPTAPTTQYQSLAEVLATAPNARIPRIGLITGPNRND